MTELVGIEEDARQTLRTWTPSFRLVPQMTMNNLEAQQSTWGDDDNVDENDDNNWAEADDDNDYATATADAAAAAAADDDDDDDDADDDDESLASQIRPQKTENLEQFPRPQARPGTFLQGGKEQIFFY